MVLFVSPERTVPILVLNTLLFATIGYGIVYIGVSYRRLGDPRLRHAVRVFFVLSAIFFPFMYIDTLIGYLSLSVFQFLDGTSLPLFYLILSGLSAKFASSHFNEPPYLENGSLTPHFCETFGISDRESEIIDLLMNGDPAKGDSDKLSISPKTIENHIYNIYQKTNVGSRVQLFNLVNSHRVGQGTLSRTAK